MYKPKKVFYWDLGKKIIEQEAAKKKEEYKHIIKNKENLE
jgi:hypothetical protein